MTAEEKVAWAKFDKELSKTSKHVRRLIKSGKLSVNDGKGRGITRVNPEESEPGYTAQ